MFRFESLSIGFKSFKTTLQIWSSSSKNEEVDSNPSKEDSNPDSKKFKLKNMKAVPISLYEDRDMNPRSTDSNSDYRKGLNGYSMTK